MMTMPDNNPMCVALGVSSDGCLLYILSDGSEIKSSFRMTGGKPGERYLIAPRAMGREASTPC